MRLVIMAKETNLKDLDTSLSKEEEDIVDSIISELNQDIPGDESVEAKPASVDVNREKAHLQQQHQQQQQQQQMMQQQMMQRQKTAEVEEKEISLVDKLKLDLKFPGIVAILTFLAVLPHSAQLIESMKISFLLDGENLNLYGLILKSLLMGFVYFVITKYVLV